MSDGAPASPRSRARLAVAGGAVLALVAAAALWAWWAGRKEPFPPSPDPEPAAAIDPRLGYPTPYKNVRPEVRYVGDRACAGCHVKEGDSYSYHPMGRALAAVADADPVERFGALARNPFAAMGLHYAVRQDKARVHHREWTADGDGPFAESEREAHFTVGSGARARSYLINRDGYLFQSPISWYTHAGRWDLAPSYELRNQHFSRPIGPGCLFCHSNFADHVEGTVNRYREPIFRGLAIGCERCHGPGELHVRRRKGGEPVDGLDDTIVNPRRLSGPLREAICQQCHLLGEERVIARGRAEFDFRPGLPLHLFLMDFVNARETRGELKFVGAVEQMRASRCYTASAGEKKLGCTSCHDPHKAPAPAEKVAHYRAACLKCHTETSCAVAPAERRKQHKDDSCVACHMPTLRTEVAHAASTDHRVPRRPAPAAAGRRATPGPDALAPFHTELLPAGDEETARNHGLALMGVLGRGLPADVARGFAQAALPRLERAVKRDGGDMPAARGRAEALWQLGRRDEARAAYEAVLAREPTSEGALHDAAELALEMNRAAAARGYFERAARINPWNWRYWHGQAVASFRGGDWSRAARESQRAVALEPTNAQARSLLVQCNLALGDPAGAKREYETIRRLTPAARRGDLGLWYQEQVRRLGR